jgi:hypothetical protein
VYLIFTNKSSVLTIVLCTNAHNCYQVAGAVVRQFRQPPGVPACLSDLGSTCTPDELAPVTQYVLAAEGNVASEALELLSTARQAFLYSALDPSVIEQYTGSWSQLTTTANFQQAVNDLEAAWAHLSNHLANAGLQENIEFEFLRKDHPAEFQSLDATSIITVTVPWPNTSRARRAKLLAPTARAYLPKVQGDQSNMVSLSMVHGPYSVFLPLNSATTTTPSDGQTYVAPPSRVINSMICLDCSRLLHPLASLVTITGTQA